MEGGGIAFLPLDLTEKQFYLQNLLIIFPVLVFLSHSHLQNWEIFCLEIIPLEICSNKCNADFDRT